MAMQLVLDVLNKKYPQNYLVRSPLIGSLILMAYCPIFALLYTPLQTHASHNFGYTATMAIYFSVATLFAFLLIVALKNISYYSKEKEWTFFKELTIVFFALSMMGIIVYLTGFMMETQSSRWNLQTLWGSYRIAFLFGIIPFAFFTFSNYRYLFVLEIIEDYVAKDDTSQNESEEKIRINSQLKKEELAFYPNQLIYAEADGNYVNFYLDDGEKKRKETIRNSISGIELQLAETKYIVRTHRAFIVNLKKIRSKKGNALGYRLKLHGTDAEIPVSRQKVASFDQLLSQYE